MDAPVLGPDDPRRIFRCDPPVVLFTDYQPGETYELPLTLTNDASVGRRCRVLPPPSRFFALADVVYPTTDTGTGVVAPGMGVKVMIRFAPDSKGDFNDTITVISEGGQFQVELQGRLPPPVLSIPSVLDVGRCLVDDRAVASFACLNTGGPGRFQLLPADHPMVIQYAENRAREQYEKALPPHYTSVPAPKSSESPPPKSDSPTAVSSAPLTDKPETADRVSPPPPPGPSLKPSRSNKTGSDDDNTSDGRVAPSVRFHDADDDDDIEPPRIEGGLGGLSAEADDAFIDNWLGQTSGNLAPFSITPTQFSLLHGQEMQFEVVFQPYASQRFSREFVLLCDNTQIYHYTLAGLYLSLLFALFFA
jgi:hypothetical protein